MSTCQRISERHSLESQVVVVIMMKAVLAFSGIYHLTLVTQECTVRDEINGLCWCFSVLNLSGLRLYSLLMTFGVVENNVHQNRD